MIPAARCLHIAATHRALPFQSGKTDMAGAAKNETSNLIASDKVEGTSVYNSSGEKLGSIYNFMVDKRSGEVEYAVLQFGGVLGLGSDCYPLPWDVLKYDTDKGGYRVDLDKRKLENAPHYAPNSQPAFDERYGKQVYGYYGVPFQ
jgi:sporulation protein YlmC with PRC-barrel domain